MEEKMITLGGIWTDFFEFIKQELGKGIIVRGQGDNVQGNYTVYSSSNQPNQLKILFFTPLDKTDIVNTAGYVLKGICKTGKGANKIHDILMQYSNIDMNALWGEHEHIETIIRKTMAVRQLFEQRGIKKEKVSDEDLSEVSLSDRAYRSVCEKLLEIFRNEYVNIYCNDSRYAWLFENHSFDDCDKIPKYLTALICAAVISAQTESPKKENKRQEIECYRERLKNNVISFLCNETKNSSADIIAYYELLWHNHVRGTGNADDRTRELIDYYTVPEFSLTDIDGNAETLICSPFHNLDHYVYITAGSGFGKTTLLEMALLASIYDTLVAANSAVVSDNSKSKKSDYAAIKKALFGENNNQYFPVFISSSTYNNTQTHILDLAETAPDVQFENMVKRAHRAGSLLFLIDSLDEVEYGEIHNEYIRKISTWLNGKDGYTRAKSILTSRFLGRNHRSFECTSIEIKELKPEAIQKIVQGKLSLNEASEFLGKLDKNPKMKSLAKNPFMLIKLMQPVRGEESGTINGVLSRVIRDIVNRRWDRTGYADKAEDVLALLGYLACKFIFDWNRNEKKTVLIRDIRNTFKQAKENLTQYGYNMEINDDNLERFLHMLSSQSGILNVKLLDQLECFVFQDSLVMSWLASYYIIEVLTNTEEVVQIGERELDMWKNMMWINEFLYSFANGDCILSADAVTAILFAIVQWEDVGKPIVSRCLLYYLLFKDLISKDEKEKYAIMVGYQELLGNVYGSSQISTGSNDHYRKMIISAIKNR